MNPKAAEAASKVLTSGYVGQGPIVTEFEHKLQAWFAHPYIVTLNSGTSALHLALHMLRDSKEQNEVLATPLTCTATNWPILANNFDIKWVDVDPETLNMDLDDLARKISRKTRAILVVHWGGVPLDLGRLDYIMVQSYNHFGFAPTIIEDCAHAFGSRYADQYLGTHGNICMYSLQAIKHVTSVDGGLLFLPKIQQYQRARLLRWYGLDRETDKKDMRCELDADEWGFKFHMNDLNAAIGMVNLQDAHGVIDKHKANAEYYNEALKDTDGVKLIKVPPMAEPSYWLYTIRVDNRNDFMKHMQSCGIHVSKVHSRNDIHSGVLNYKALLPGMDRVDGEYISIPVGWWVTEKERQYIVECIQRGW
jgi:dTDP-4-amino-4,6-dideoxygalactose transaminase